MKRPSEQVSGGTGLIIVAVLSLALGGAICSFMINQRSYGRVGEIATQGRVLVTRILEEKERIGSYPSQEWFKSLGSERFTAEKRLWCYHMPPLDAKGPNKILLTTPIDLDHKYAVGYDDGTVCMWDIEEMLSSADDGVRKNTKRSEQADGKTPDAPQPPH
jgi:hypothetical protein